MYVVLAPLGVLVEVEPVVQGRVQVLRDRVGQGQTPSLCS